MRGNRSSEGAGRSSGGRGRSGEHRSSLGGGSRSSGSRGRFGGGGHDYGDSRSDRDDRRERNRERASREEHREKRERQAREKAARDRAAARSKEEQERLDREERERYESAGEASDPDMAYSGRGYESGTQRRQDKREASQGQKDWMDRINSEHRKGKDTRFERERFGREVAGVAETFNPKSAAAKRALANRPMGAMYTTAEEIDAADWNEVKYATEDQMSPVAQEARRARYEAETGIDPSEHQPGRSFSDMVDSAVDAVMESFTSPFEDDPTFTDPNNMPDPDEPGITSYERNRRTLDRRKAEEENVAAQNRVQGLASDYSVDLVSKAIPVTGLEGAAAKAAGKSLAKRAAAARNLPEHYQRMEDANPGSGYDAFERSQGYQSGNEKVDHITEGGWGDYVADIGQAALGVMNPSYSMVAGGLETVRDIYDVNNALPESYQSHGKSYKGGIFDKSGDNGSDSGNHTSIAAMVPAVTAPQAQPQTPQNTMMNTPSFQSFYTMSDAYGLNDPYRMYNYSPYQVMV